MFNYLKSAHGACVKEAAHFMLVKINNVPLKLEELLHFASFPNIVCIFILKKFLQFIFRKSSLLKSRSRVKSISRVTEINRAMMSLVLRESVSPIV